MKLLLRTATAAVALMLLGSGVSYAEQVIREIDHPNGPSTYAFAPADRDSRLRTVGVSDGYYDREIIDRDVVVVSRPAVIADEGVTTIPLQRGRGEVIYVPVQR